MLKLKDLLFSTCVINLRLFLDQHFVSQALEHSRLKHLPI